MWNGKYLKSARIKLGMTQKELADEVNVHELTVSRWETSQRDPKAGDLSRLAVVLHTTVGYLMGEEGGVINGTMNQRVRNTKEEKRNQPAEITECNASMIPEVTIIPKIDKIISVSAPSGNEAPNIEWNIIDTYPIASRELIGSWQSKQMLCMDVNGDSMEPYIHNGDMVIFVVQERIVAGEVAVVSYDGAILVKGVIMSKDLKKITLVSYNKAYPDREINIDDHELNIIGKVIKILNVKTPPSVI